LQRQSRCITSHRKEGDTFGVGQTAVAARGDEKVIGRWGIEHNGLSAREPPAFGVTDGARSDVRELIAPGRLIGGEGNLELSRGDLR
jgi:hypothetical protein